ncbi:hypothetical protein NFI95_14815 [Acetobacteraceae bacterium KSS8]|uniref:Uncharacterized protein n=1 Tax=Endosaccharibacter trunci TaxID=2812733 RepID=A0ABT1W9Z5_9PROT|nr:hypothetical protein [Acetobacteraceae bacterium KSS8]
MTAFTPNPPFRLRQNANRPLVVAALLVASAFGASREAQAGSCSDRRAQLAATAAETLPNWSAVTRYWKHFRSCEGDALHQTVSGAIGALLVVHWNQLPALAAEVRRQPKLRGFVLAHIDDTLDRDQVTRIRQEAGASCPRGARSLCADIRQAATRTLDRAA